MFVFAAYGVVLRGFLTEKDRDMNDEKRQVYEITLARKDARLSSHDDVLYKRRCMYLFGLQYRRVGTVVSASKVALVVLELDVR